MITISGIVSVLFIEGILRLNQMYVDAAIAHSATQSEALVKTNSAMVMPKILEKREVQIPGADYAYYWQNRLHVFNEKRMRMTAPVPPKDPTVFRIAVFGDSMTYGQGVDNSDTYSSLIERKLKEHYRVEVINFGIMGHESEDILALMKEEIPIVQPDLVIYGVCLNDYLRSKILYYDNNYAFKIPIQEKWKIRITQHSLLGSLLQKKYNDVLMKYGLRNDYYADVLKNFNAYQNKFRDDVIAMNSLVVKRGLPPIMTMIINEYPMIEGSAADVSIITEQFLREAGMTVIPIWSYYIKHDHERLEVNQWESHPNEQAHAIFAEYFLRYLEIMPQLSNYKKI